MKVSIITVVFNGEKTIKDTIDSIQDQSFKNIEHIIIDGGSTDDTVNIVKSYGDKISKFISEKDDGLYDAMNKGINLASGNIVGILNSDDLYINEFTIEKITHEFLQKGCDSVYGDLVYVKENNTEKVIRYYDSSNFNPNKFAYGWMPAHPTFFVKRDIYMKYGLYRTDLKLESDFDLLLRFLLLKKISYSYIREPLVKMRIGGASTSGLKAKWLIAKEQNISCRDNGVKTNIFKIMSKYPYKIFESLKRN